MANLLELQRQHRVFAEETFAFLLGNFKMESKCLKGYEFFRPYIGDAVLTISYVFRKDYWKIFSRLRENLKHVKMFENYCKIVPVKKDKRYFYYILTRISLIFELSMYCYNEGYDYFKTGWQCVAEYADLQFFESSGGWGRLGHTSLFIASIGQPLTLMMTQLCSDQDDKNLTFSEIFDALDKHFILTGNLNMLDGAEMYCLTHLNKMFQAKARNAPKFKPRKEIESTKNLNTSLKAAAADAKGSDRDLITEYFKKCLFDLVSSRALGYSIKNLEESLPNLAKVSTVKDCENLTDLVDSCGLQSATFDIELDFSDKKVVYIKQFETSYQPASIKCRRPYFLNKRKQTTAIKVSIEKSALEMFQSNSGIHSSQTTSNLSERNFQIPNRKDPSLKCTDPIPIEVHQSTECSEKVLPEIPADKSEDLNLKIENYKLDENLTSQEDFSVPTFIVPQKYLSFRNSNNPSKCMYLYSVKMCPPSTRKMLDEPIRKLLDENIDNQNYKIMPSGDIIVCPRVSPQKEDTLIILAESSTDDEVEEDIDILICLFKKMEIDSQGSESGYSLRPRQRKLLEKARSSDDSDGAETITTERTESDNETPLKFFQRVQRKPGGFIRYKTLPTEKLIRLYKKYFTSFLDVYFEREFFPQSTGVQSSKSSSISKCEHVFAVTASIMAKRRVLLDDPNETKRVLGIQLYDKTFRLEILPLAVQKALDSQIRRHKYFHTSNGIYGVGPKRTAAEENIWVIFYSGNGKSNSLEFNHEDLKEIPKIFRSYEPILEIFIPLPKDTIKLGLELFESFLNDLVAKGLQEDLKLSIRQHTVISL